MNKPPLMGEDNRKECVLTLMNKQQGDVLFYTTPKQRVRLEVHFELDLSDYRFDREETNAC
jgi:hypothetical protein